MRHRTTLLSAALTAVVTVVAAACADATAPAADDLSPGALALNKAAKVTVCHAAGRDGTTKYVEITISGNAGQNPHIDDNGTTRAGHEDDYYKGEGLNCGDGRLEVCVAYDPGDEDVLPYNPAFSSLLTATGGSLTVLSRTYTGAGPLECSGAVAAPAGTYLVDHPAPGVAEVDSDGNGFTEDNGTWFIERVAVSPAGNGIAALPAFGTSWDDDFGRGKAGWTTVAVVANGSTVVTFYDVK